MIKIVTIDLDGTLFDSKKNISNENIIAINKCKELGIKIVIATGRPFNGVWPLLEKLNLTSKDDYVILYNGAKIMNCETKEIIYSATINGNDIKDIYNESIRLDCDFHAFMKDGTLITPKFNPYTNVESSINHIEAHLNDIISLDDNLEFIKAMIVSNDENINYAISNINNKFKNKYNMVRSSKIFLEFLPKIANKGLALKKLANYLNIDIKDTMAIGDAGNDISMIELSGIGIAMENAFPDVKIVADYITKSNEDSGVAYALNKYIIKK